MNHFFGYHITPPVHLVAKCLSKDFVLITVDELSLNLKPQRRALNTMTLRAYYYLPLLAVEGSFIYLLTWRQTSSLCRNPDCWSINLGRTVQEKLCDLYCMGLWPKRFRESVKLNLQTTVNIVWKQWEHIINGTKRLFLWYPAVSGIWTPRFMQPFLHMYDLSQLLTPSHVRTFTVRSDQQSSGFTLSSDVVYWELSALGWCWKKKQG